MANHILFVFEGEKTEKEVLKSLNQHFLNEVDETVIYSVFCGEIYSLYHLLKKDEDLELFGLLKEKAQNKELLANLKFSDVSEIYMFFDYDGHATAASDEKLQEMLELFDDETESGKLYISYPMVESIKNLPTVGSFKDLSVKCKENINYKNFVHCSSKSTFRDLARLNKEQWDEIIDVNLRKLSLIVNNSYEISDQYYEQAEVFQSQLNKFILPSQEVSVLSAFPVFLADYYGVSNLLSK